MKPKDKAKELVDIYEDRCPEFIKKNTAKWCALIAVDEILDSVKNNFIYSIKFHEYWQEVKKEIEQL